MKKLRTNPLPVRPAIAVAVRRILLAVTLSAGSLGVSGIAAAAEQQEDELEAVVITGSRIARTEEESTNPVQVITSASILEQGSQNIADILEQLPAVGTAGFSRNTTNFASFGNGLSTINLRNAGDSRTLVLMNGRRVVSGLAGDSTVDLNNIPTDLIESVEVMTGGASATYGSEAIAGAVNFRMKDDFEGLSVRAQTGATTEGDSERHMFSMTGGWRFMETGNLVGNVTYDQDNGLRSKNRAISADDIPFRSSYVPQGRFDVASGVIYTYDANNALKTGYTNDDGYNRNADRYIAVPMERTLITVLADVPLTQQIEAFFEGSYSKYKTNSRLEANPTDNSDAHDANGNEYPGLTLDNPYIPAQVRDAMIANGVTALQFRKRWTGLTDRSNQTEREFQRYVVGVRGELADKWSWDAYLLDGRSIDDTQSETALRTRFFNAVDVIAGPSGPMCRSAAARAEGCAPMNLFGFDSVSQAAVDYMTVNGTALDTYDASSRQQVAAANITGALMDLPAGSWRIATGIEYREEDAKQEFSPDTQAGNTLGNALSNTYGEYDVTEAYLETVVPVLRDLPFIKSLELEAAYRYGDYSTVGGVDSWKAGVNWAVDSNVRLRAVYSNAVRAPNISELFGGQNQTFPSGITDPCDGIGATTAPSGKTQTVVDYCRALPGFAQNVALPGNGGVFTSQENTDVQSYEGFDGGNPDLGKETAKTWTVGLVFTPGFMPNFSMTIDWFDIQISDAIAVVPRDFIVNQCAESGGTGDTCGFITREPAAPIRPRSPGVLWQINSGPVNAASIESSGIDVGMHYAHAFQNGHRLTAAVNYTYQDKLTLEPVAGEPIQDNVGQLVDYAGGRLGSGFEHRGVLSLGYSVGAFRATWRTLYQSAMDDDITLAPEDDGYLHVNSAVYHDAQVHFAFGKEAAYGVYLGVDNVFGKKPPLIDQTHNAWFPGTETSPGSYDPIGRFVYAGIDVKL